MADETTDATSTDTTDATSTTDTTDTGATLESTQTAESAKPQTVAELQAALQASEALRVSAESTMRAASGKDAESRRELKKLQEAQKAADDAGKTELQKAQDDLKAAQDELTGTRAVARRHTLLSEVRKVGSKLNVTFNESALADLYGAGHFDAIEANEEGAFDDLEGFTKGLIKERSYILQNQTQSPDIHSQSKGKGGLNEFDAIRQKSAERNKAKAVQTSWQEKVGLAR